MQKVYKKVKQGLFLHSKKGEFFLGVGVKILIAVLIGAAFLGGTYSLTKDSVMPNVESKVRGLFDYNGGVSNENAETENETVVFTIEGMGTFETTNGNTWADWILSYGISAGDNGIVWIGYRGLGDCTSPDVGKIYADVGNGPGYNNVQMNYMDVMCSDVIVATTYSVAGPK